MQKKFCKALYPTPVLNTPCFSYVFGSYPQGVALDSEGLLYPLETIALKGELFEIVSELEDYANRIFSVSLQFYPSNKPLYIDARFVTIVESPLTADVRKIPSSQVILERLNALVGYPYVWGGNWSKGIEQMKSFYPMNRQLTFHERANWLMQGVDCSGLLYEVTEGYTPRNTADLIHFGDFVKIENKSPKQIKSLIRPLDLIVWKGHVIIALDENTTIESRARRGGVVLTDLEQRLEQIIVEDKKTPASNMDSDNKDAYYIKTSWI